jgi:hypothetical protein
MAVIVLISFRVAFAGLLKDHAVAVFYLLTTRSSTRSSYTTSMDSTGYALTDVSAVCSQVDAAVAKIGALPAVRRLQVLPSNS